MAIPKDCVYDLYVLNMSGLPIFAGCTGSEYCKNHLDQHELHSCFFSAIYAFSKESFKETVLRTISFDKLQINFLVDEPNDVQVIFVHPQSAKRAKVIKHLKIAHDLYLQKYKARLPPNEVNEALFTEFKKDLMANKIIPTIDIIATSSMQALKDKLLSLWN